MEHTSITRANEEISSLRQQIQRVRGKMKESTESAVMVAEVIAGGGAAGMLRGRYPDKQILGLEPDLVIGAALLIGSWWVGGAYAQDLLHLGAGFAAAYACMEMKALGEKMRQDANKPAPAPYPLPRAA